MQPNLSNLLSPTRSSPNLELLRRLGWQIGSWHGRYAVAWKGASEVLLEWTGDGWKRVGGKGDL